jgi:hypothetical protein
VNQYLDSYGSVYLKYEVSTGRLYLWNDSLYDWDQNGPVGSPVTCSPKTTPRRV